LKFNVNEKSFGYLNTRGKANVIQRVHKPVWKSLYKTSLSGNLETMQYLATFNPTASISDDSPYQAAAAETGGDEYWLTNAIIDVPLVSPQVQSPEIHELSNKA
jgi:hypothetical protein